MFQVIGWSQTVKVCWRSVRRRAAFFTTANASGRISSSFAHCSARSGNGRQLRLPGGRFRAEIVVGERLELLVELVNATDSRHQALDFALIFRSEYFL